MLNWINKRDVESDEGFSFKCAHRFYYYYIEDGKVLKIFVEPIKNGLEVIFPSSPKWEEPHIDVLITETKICEIEARVCNALKFMGIKYKIQKDHT